MIVFTYRQISFLSKNFQYNFFCTIKQATQHGYFDRVKQLVEEEGVDVRQPDAENVTMLHWASINNRLEIMQ